MKTDEPVVWAVGPKARRERTTLRFITALVVLGTVALEAVRSTTGQDRPKDTPPREFTMTALELEQLSDVLELDESFAAVCSGQSALSELVRRGYREGWKDATLRADAERRLGVAVVRSGAIWAERRR